ncbi:MAG: cytochrome c oxidase subunit II [Hyphomicrobiales bacterium]|nr:cytochrome c oxidase subunit II [Hyphomicrobiales bacterium]
MAITSPENRIWWAEKVGRAELIWITIAFLWGVFMFAMMVWWHLEGNQNLSNEVYRIVPEVFEEKTEAFTEKYTVREESGIPVAKPEPGVDVYMLSRLWEWWPILELKKGQTYRLHLSSMDWQHGFSLQPVNINIQVHPGLEHVVTLTPTQTGEFSVVCNEYCGVGHHTMVGRIHVVD